MSDFDLLEGESVEDFAVRIKALHEGPTWAELRNRHDHRDKAYEFLSRTSFTGDAEMAKVMVDAATVHAQIAVADKLEELTQTIKASTGEVLDRVTKLDTDIQTAAQHLHKDAHELKTQLRVIQGERDAA